MEKYLPVKFGSRLNRAFKEMESKGIIARQNWACCMTCGFAELEMEIVKSDKSWIGMTFYHQQDGDSRKKGYNFNLAYDTNSKDYTQTQIGEMICECLKNNGVKYGWNGDARTRIEVIQDERTGISKTSHK